jgi:hypothetical protein
MATVTKKSKIEQVTRTIVENVERPDGYSIHLSENEANGLRQLLGRIAAINLVDYQVESLRANLALIYPFDADFQAYKRAFIVD